MVHFQEEGVDFMIHLATISLEALVVTCRNPLKFPSPWNLSRWSPVRRREPAEVYLNFE